MSIDLKVFPTIPEIAAWGEIKREFCFLLGCENENVVDKNPLLLVLKSQQEVADSEQLSLGECYYLSLATPNTLSISVISKTEDIDEENLELDYLEDYGDNLSSEQVQILVERWRVARYFYSITSFGGRSQLEPMLLVKLATAVAHVCSGYIVVTENSLFDLGIGVYTPDEFQCVKPNF